VTDYTSQIEWSEDGRRAWLRRWPEVCVEIVINEAARSVKTWRRRGVRGMKIWNSVSDRNKAFRAVTSWDSIYRDGNMATVRQGAIDALTEYAVSMDY